MVITLTGQVLALVAVVIAAGLLHRASRLELSLACVLAGFLAGLGVEVMGFDTGIRASNLQDIVFYLILPVLIFEAAWHLKAALLRRWLTPILLLAIVGVLLSSVVTAALVYHGVGHPTGFPWMAALLTGATLAATDPVAVVNQLRSLKAPTELATLFEGESLFNDATAIVLFSMVLALAMDSGGDASAPRIAGHFALVFFGGLLTGVVTGLCATAVTLVLGRPASTTLVLLFTAFGTFYLAEHLVGVSGIMAVMAAALVCRGFLTEVEDTVAKGLGHSWSWLGELFNSLLFVIMGLTITIGMFQTHWLAMVIAIIAALVGRAVAVGASGVLSRPLGIAIPAAWQLLLIWGGLRGAIALALVLSLPVELPYWYTVQSMVFGVVLFSLVVQGTTNGALIRRLAHRTDRHL